MTTPDQILDESTARSSVEKSFPDCNVGGAIDPQPNRYGNFVFEVFHNENSWRFIPRRVTVRRNGTIMVTRMFSYWSVTEAFKALLKSGVALILAGGLFYGFILMISSGESGDGKGFFAGIGIMTVSFWIIKWLFGGKTERQ